MASTETPREIMNALIENRTPRRKSKTVYSSTYRGRGRTGSTSFERTKAIFSYGPHFPMAFEQDGIWWVNTERYELTGMVKSYRDDYPRLRRKLSYSAMTEIHKKGVVEALREHGFTPNGATIERDGYTFQAYIRGSGIDEKGTNMDDELTDQDIDEALAQLVADGHMEVVDRDGQVAYRLTPSGFEEAAHLVSEIVLRKRLPKQGD